MGDEAEERLVCKLKVGMRVGRFKLKLHLRNRLMSSSWKLHRLSFVVRFRKHHLRIDSESKPECGRKSRLGGFIRSLGVLWRRRVEENVGGSKKKMDEQGIWNGSLGIYALSSNDIKVGTSIEVDGAPWRVLEFLHVKPGKGAAFVRTKIRNYVNGSTVERTFRAGITIEEANVSKETKQFTYKDGSQFVFMDLSSYEETRLNEADMGDKTKWLKEGMDCNLLYWKDKVIDFELPITVQLKIVDVDPGLRGDTAQGGTKPATLETGAVVNVPLFVNVGEDIMVDTRTGTYMSRV
uniref:Translation elongation factor P/YeiP central domain-containing protein n=1 Tax=Brassica campestris TaxID=3711 RepID=M4CZJ7_BRACM